MVEEADEECEIASPHLSPQAEGEEEPRTSAFSPSSSELWPSDLGGTVTPIAPPPATKPPAKTDDYPPAAEGHAGSLEIYRDPDGQLVKFDSIGRKYPVDARGTRTTRLKPNECPPDFSPEDYKLAVKMAKSSGRSADEYLADIRARRAASTATGSAAPAVLSKQWPHTQSGTPTDARTAPSKVPTAQMDSCGGG